MKKHIKRLKLLTLLGLFLLVIGCDNNQRYNFKYSEPESKGFSSSKLDTLKKHLENSGASSMMILVDGEVIFDWGSTSKKHLIHSIRKALLNSIFGIAVDQGKIDTSITLRELDIQDIEPILSENELNARVADLLRSRSGIYHNAAAVTEGMLSNMPERNQYKPGEHYYYNNWDFNVLGAILEQQTGISIYELFYEEIAIPLGMNEYKGEYCLIDGESEDEEIPETDGVYQFEKSKSKYPAYHFRMSARDLALYGQLYLDRGDWNGKQIISEEWIETSAKPYSLYDPERGFAYGMLWNVILPNEGEKYTSLFHTGLGIHLLGIYPNLNMVIVHRVDTENEFAYEQTDFYKMISLTWDAKNH